MNNNFTKEELVKVQGKEYPVVGGRLRLAHEHNDKLNIETTVITFENEKLAVIQAKVTTDNGIYNGYGTSTSNRDSRLKKTLLELAETRAIARALRFSGYGVEYTGAEEMQGVENVTSDKITTQQLIDMGKSKGISEQDILKLYAKEHKKVSEVKFIPQAIKQEYYNRLEAK